MDLNKIAADALPPIFAGLLLLVLSALVKYLRDISRDVRSLKISVPVLTERLSGYGDRISALESHARKK